MSLSRTHRPLTGSRGFPAKTVVALFVLIAIAATSATLVQNSFGSSDTAAVSARLGHAKFLELNTTALPPTASAGDAPPQSAMPLERFLEINTTGMPSLADTSDENVSDHFLYWNVDSFETATAKSAADEKARAAAPVSGPR